MYGARIIAPLGFLAGGVQAKQTFGFEGVHFGVFGSAGGIASLRDNRDNNSGFYFTGGALVTIGDEDAAFTAGGYIFGGRWNHYGHAYVANANAFYRTSKRLKLIIDAFTPVATHRHSTFGKWTALSYGIRYGGADMSGDIGFVLPIHDDMGDLMKFAPLGIPFVTFNILF